MLPAQLVHEGELIHEKLSERIYTRNKRDRERLLREAVDASLRALPVLAQEPLITNTRQYLEDSYQRLNANPYALREELRQDALLLRMFMSAETRLLNDIGVHGLMLDGIVTRLIETIYSDAQEPVESLEGRIGDLISELQRDLDSINREVERRGTEARLAGVLGVIGGALLCFVNTAATVASHGLAAGAGAASVSLGSGMVGRSLGG